MSTEAGGNLQPEQPTQPEPVSSDAISPFKPSNFPEETPANWPKPTSTLQTPQYDANVQAMFSIQLRALEQHFDDQIKIMTVQMQTQKVELDAKIDLLRTRTSELRTKRQEKNRKGWDIRILLLSIVVTALLTILVENYWDTFWKWATRP